jgi:hypothetical protein
VAIATRPSLNVNAHTSLALEVIGVSRITSGDLKSASQSFIPSGLFTPAGDSTVPPEARAIFASHVLAADEKINVLTSRAFYWALVETFGGAYDVVIDSNLLPRVPEVGGVISGSFWLSGRIIARYQG